MLTVRQHARLVTICRPFMPDAIQVCRLYLSDLIEGPMEQGADAGHILSPSGCTILEDNFG